MTLEQFYLNIEGDYNDVFLRLGSDDRIKKYIKLFFNSGDIEGLDKAIKENDANSAFEFAHKLKGNSLNIGFYKFSRIAEELVEPLRPRVINEPARIMSLHENVKYEYDYAKSFASMID